MTTVTPEAIRTVSKLRGEFYSLFADSMNVPVKISGSSYNSISSIASWVDDRERLNYVNIYAYTAPDDLLTQRPFILRVSINKGAGSIASARQGKPCRGLNQRWHFELTVLPDELLDFLPWIVSLVESQFRELPTFDQEPPHPLTLDLSNLLHSKKVWTQEAEKTVALQQSAIALQEALDNKFDSSACMNAMSASRWMA